MKTIKIFLFILISCFFLGGTTFVNADSGTGGVVVGVTVTITPSVVGGGTISPAVAQVVDYNTATSFTVTPNSGYVLSSVGGTCGGTLVGNTYTTNAVTADCTVVATFVALVMSGTLTPASSTCTIAVNSDTCTTNPTLTWTTTNPVSISMVTNNGGATPAGPTGNNSSSAFIVPYNVAMGGVTSFYLYNNGGSPLAIATITASCVAGTSWDGSRCNNIPPVANAGPDKAITLPVATSAPTGTSATDTPLGTITSTVWTQVGTTPSVATITGGTTLTPTFSNLTTSGTYIFRLTVTDNNGAVSIDNMLVAVSPAPLIMSGTLTSSAPSCIIALNASTCPVTLTWAVTNPEAVLGSNVTSSTDNSGLASPNFVVEPPVTTGTVDGGTKTLVAIPYSSRTFFLNNNAKSLVPTSPSGGGITVTSSCTAGSSWNGTICANIPPVANAGPDKAITLPVSTSAPTGTSATDTPLGSVVSTIWTQVGSTPSVATITGGTTLTPTFSGLSVSGTYTFRLTVTDNNGATSIDNMLVAVSPALIMSGTLTPASSTCTIAIGASSCTSGTLTWTTTNPVATSAVTNNGTATPASPTGNNSSSTFTVPYNSAMGGVTSFYLYNNSLPLATATVTTNLAPGCTWNGTICAENLAVPTVTSPTATSITATTVTLGANVTSLGNPATISARGICGSTAPNPTLTNGAICRLATGITTGVYTVNFTNLTSGTLYHYAGYATNATGTGYSPEGTFTSAGSTSGTLTPASSTCTIAVNSDTCTTNPTLTWTTTNPVATSAVTNNGTATPASPTGNNSSSTFTVPYYTAMGGVTSFYLYNNGGSPLAIATVTTSCTAGSSWNGTICANIPPVVSAGTDGAITLPTTTISPVGTSATDTGGSVISTVWTQVGTTPSVATITGGNTLTPTFSNLTTAGTYTFLLTVTDNNGGVTTDTVLVVVSPAPLIMSGTLTSSAPSCIIALNASTCPVTLTWAVTNPEAVLGSNVTSSTDNSGLASPNFVVEPPVTTGTVDGGTKTLVAIPYSSRTFFLNNNAKSLVPASPSGGGITVTSSCFAGSSWNGTICAENLAVPTVTSPTATSITATTVTLGANVTSLGNPAAISARGICGSTAPNPTLATGICRVATGTTTGVYTVNFTGLTSGTLYHYAGYATNATGTGYSPEGTFTATAGTTGNITATPCTIPLGGNTCLVPITLNWNVTNPVGTSTIRTPFSTSTPAIYTSASGATSGTYIHNTYIASSAPNTETFHIVNNGFSTSATSTVSCANGTHWGVTSCIQNAPDSSNTVFLINGQAGPTVTTYKGRSILIVWDSPVSDTCTGTNFSTDLSPSNLSAITGSATMTPLVNTTYSISCQNPSGTTEKSISVKVINLKIQEN